MENQQYLQEKEINLRDCINVMIRRKKLILSVFLIAMVTFTIVSLSLPKAYEITSTVQLGSVNGLLIGKEDAKEIILNQNSLLSIIKELNLKTEVERLRKNIKINDVNGTDLLKIKMEYADADTALKIADAILNPLITQGRGIY